MSTHPIDFQFISFDVPTHWHISRESHEDDDEILHLSKNIEWCGPTEIRPRRYSKQHQLPRTDKKRFEHLMQFAHAAVDRRAKQQMATLHQVISHEEEKTQTVAATLGTYDDVVEIGGIMRVW
jgi:hypothetical protein